MMYHTIPLLDFSLEGSQVTNHTLKNTLIMYFFKREEQHFDEFFGIAWGSFS